MNASDRSVARDIGLRLYRWRYLTVIMLASGMWWMGNDRLVTWIVFLPFLVALVNVPMWIHGPRTLRRSFSGFRAGLRGE